MAAKLILFILLSVATFLVATLWKARRNTQLAETCYPPEGDILHIDGTPVHAVVKGSGPDLVLIHGSSGSTRDFTFSLLDRLAEHYRVIAFDRPGLGYTGAIENPTLLRQAELLRRAAAQLGADRPIVLGQSYGGSVALAWAVAQQEHIAALVALATPSQVWHTPLSRFYRAMSHPIVGPIFAAILAAWVNKDRVARAVESVFAPQSAPKGYGDHFGPRLSLRRSCLRANALQRANLLEEITALSQQYEAITTPVELLHGDADTTVGLDIHSRPLSAQIATANLTILPGIGHMPHHVAQDDIIAAVHRATQRAGLH